MAKRPYLSRNYDHIARYYDRLSRWVFGMRQMEPQLYLLQHIPPNAHLLLLGGGTGWILEAIAERQPSSLTITYVDASAKMIAIARKRNAGGNTVTFIIGNAETAALTGSYDAVLTPFLLDNLTNETLKHLLANVKPALNEGAQWLDCDFRNTQQSGKKLLLKTMYFFFGMWCGVTARRLPDVDAAFKTAGWISANYTLFSKGFIRAIVYKIGNNNPK